MIKNNKTKKAVKKYTGGDQLTAMLTGLLCLAAVMVISPVSCRRKVGPNDDISLWIDERQVREFSGLQMEIFAIVDGQVLPYILDPNFERYLPVIPSEVSAVNFTWKAGVNKNYFYNFDVLESSDATVLEHPTLSITRRGKVPYRAQVFRVGLSCVGNVSGTAAFSIGLDVENDRGMKLPGTPLRFKLLKLCANNVPDANCKRNCKNGGRCNKQNICVCPTQYMGQKCETALCYPQCLNGGICVRPGECQCKNGYQGPQCEGGLCEQRCLNGGKCVQKDVCACTKGYYGPRCQYSKCTIPCLNKGRCVGVNQCRCRRPFEGDRCEKRNPSFIFRGNRRKKKKIFV